MIRHTARDIHRGSQIPGKTLESGGRGCATRPALRAHLSAVPAGDAHTLIVEELELCRNEARIATNCCFLFGGSEQLYVTEYERGRLERFDVGVRGLLARHLRQLAPHLVV
jgi:hypothetical protein